MSLTVSVDVDIEDEVGSLNERDCRKLLNVVHRRLAEIGRKTIHGIEPVCSHDRAYHALQLLRCGLIKEGIWELDQAFEDPHRVPKNIFQYQAALNLGRQQ